MVMDIDVIGRFDDVKQRRIGSVSDMNFVLWRIILQHLFLS